MSVIRKIGFIGVGNMGSPMAGHLLKNGFDVTVYDIRPEVVKAFVSQHGGKGAASLVDVAHGADAVITMGCGDACPIYPGKRYEDWELEDSAGKDLETVRRIRDEIAERVKRLLVELAPEEPNGPS